MEDIVGGILILGFWVILCISIALIVNKVTTKILKFLSNENDFYLRCSINLVLSFLIMSICMKYN
jgi:hypothetical protein